MKHEFRELIGRDKRFLNVALRDNWVETADQWIRLKVANTGVELASASRFGAAKSMPPRVPPARYDFDRPFLLILTMRGAKNPFFVMWVAKAELLVKR